MLTTQEIRQLGNKELMEEMQKARRELLKSQFDMRMGTSKEVHTQKNFKRYIARLQTIAKEEASKSKPETVATATTPKAPAKVKKSPAPKKTAAVKKAPAKSTKK